jgi:SH3 domain protein
MKAIPILLLIVSFLISPLANAESAYIYEQEQVQDRGIWTRTGPSKEYKVSNRYLPGTKLSIIAGTETDGYTQVIDSRGRKSWIRSSVLTPTANVLLDQARQEIARLKQSHEDEIKALQAELSARAPLEKTNQTLQSKIAEMQFELENLRQSNQAMSAGFDRDTYFAGGVTVIVGVLLGWLFGLRGRKRNSAWS